MLARVKVSSYIIFPETLDLSSYVRSTSARIVYHLKAVLLHIGPTAYAGHYVAFIKEPTVHNVLIII